MPVIEVEIILKPGESLPDGLAAHLAHRLGEIFASPPGGAWVRLRCLPETHYAENGADNPAAVHPVFVSVLKRSADPLAKRRLEVAQVTAAIAQVCQRSAENVHILYLPPAAGRQAFGGVLQE